MRRRPGRISVLCGVLAALAIVVAPIAGQDSAPPHSTTRRGSISISYPSSWTLASVVTSEIFGLRFSHELVLARGRDTLVGGGIVNGSPVPGGIPPSFSRRIGGARSRRTVEVNGHTAVRYSGQSQDGARRLTLYVLPTDRGDLGLLCLSARPSSPQDPCAISALRLTMRGRRAVPPGADPGLARSLEKALDPVENARSESNLVALDSPGSIAQAMGALADVAENAATRIAALSPEPRNRHAVLSGLEAPLSAEARALSWAADSARAEEHARYEEAVRSAVEFSRRLHSGVVKLRTMGFSLPHLAPLDLPQLPKPESSELGTSTGPTEQVNDAGAKGFPPSGQGGSGSGGSPQTEPAKPVESEPTEPTRPLE
jgi:hypothetical protein